MAGKSRHTPSRYRALVRRIKSGEKTQVLELVKEAERLGDPYYTGLALFDIALRGDTEESLRLARQAIAAAEAVEAEWRRAEVLAVLAKKLQHWKDEAEKKKLQKRLLKAVQSMELGEGMSEAIRGCSPHMECGMHEDLLRLALQNRGFEAKDGKAVIKDWVRKCSDTEDIIRILEEIEDPYLMSRLTGYLHTQCVKAGSTSYSFLETAAGAALRSEDPVDALRYLVKQSSTERELKIILSLTTGMANAEQRCRVLNSLAGKADSLGFRSFAMEIFETALEESKEIREERDRAAVLMNLGTGMVRLGEMKRAELIYKTAARSAEGNPRLMQRICESMKKSGMDLPDSCRDVIDKMKEAVEERKEITDTILALYNTYEGGIGSAHLRAVSRAGPLCFAYGMDLMLINFPVSDTKKLVERVRKETNIGRGGKYLAELEREGRIILASGMKKIKKIEENIVQVATTSHPDVNKKIDMSEVMNMRYAGKKPCIIMGLGKKGLPDDILKEVPYHMELTGRNIPLETCTVMGIIAERVALFGK